MSDAAPVNVLLVDDHHLVRAGIRALLEGIPGVRVVAEASSGEQALEKLAEHVPDVVVMDIAMKGMTGLEATSRAREAYPEVPVVILSMHGEEEYVVQSLRAGASAYLLKESATQELELALRSVLRGETYLSPPVSKQVVEGYLKRTGSESPGSDLLTPRQREVLGMIARGLGTKEVAFRLGLSVKTVEAHRSQIMERLGIRDVAGLVRYAIRIGLISASD